MYTIFSNKQHNIYYWASEFGANISPAARAAFALWVRRKGSVVCVCVCCCRDDKYAKTNVCEHDFAAGRMCRAGERTFTSACCCISRSSS